ncbi:hypothetical protein [Providencia sp. PROV120]|uniref:hypothetical protein n=1 Tax=Providencia sp. PROV120 TaxID=2949831 RepID=UPI00234B627D|nr:hypothetical protein [Providencia sp. PROV120]
MLHNENKSLLREKISIFNQITDQNTKMVFMKEILVEIYPRCGEAILYRPHLDDYLYFSCDGYFYFKFIRDDLGELKDFHIEEIL